MATVGITRVHCNSGITLLAVSPVKPRRLPSSLCAPPPASRILLRSLVCFNSRSLSLPAFHPRGSFATAESRSVAGPMFQRTKLRKLSEVRREWEKFLSPADGNWNAKEDKEERFRTRDHVTRCQSSSWIVPSCFDIRQWIQLILRDLGYGVQESLFFFFLFKFCF